MSSRAGLAAVLSFVLPGLGQVYNGHFIRAGFWLLMAFWVVDQPAAWPFDAGFWQWMTHVLPAVTAFQKARQLELLDRLRREMQGRAGGGRVIDV